MIQMVEISYENYESVLSTFILVKSSENVCLVWIIWGISNYMVQSSAKNFKIRSYIDTRPQTFQ